MFQRSVWLVVVLVCVAACTASDRGPGGPLDPPPPGTDAGGYATGRQAFLYALCLLMTSLVPALMGFQSIWYFFGALILGVGFCATAARFLWRRDRSSARLLFFASILYLPLVLGLLVFF